MGVHGLSTYLRENQRSLSRTLTLTCGAPPKNRVSVVVDGWSFIYSLHYRADLPWAYGGEYDRFGDIVVRLVNAWIAAGLELYFVFDGPYNSLKFTTVIARSTKSLIQPANLFFRTSSTSRSTARFLRETQMLPPLCYRVCIQALQSLDIEHLHLFFADQECDPFAVELAGHLKGYVMGQDSDYAVLNCDGYKGYIPLDDVVWSAPLRQATGAPSAAEDGSGFQEVKKPKSKKTAASAIDSSTLIPLEGVDLSDLTLSMTVYQPGLLAARLTIPTTILPLLGALVGNDFTNVSPGSDAPARKTVQSMIFDRSLTLSQRIDRVAATLASILATATPRKGARPVGSVVELIDRAVRALIVRNLSTFGSGEIEGAIEHVVEAALQYAIPKPEGDLWPTAACALHTPDACPLMRIFSSDDDAEGDHARGEVRNRYVTVYHAGRLHPRTLDPLSTGTAWPRIFLEHPDLEGVARSIGRPLREWIYTLLDHGAGLPERVVQEESDLEEDGDEEDDEDELVDVVEENSDEESDNDDSHGDLLGPLRRQMAQLREGDADGANAESLTSSQAERARRTLPKAVVEHIRRGTHLAAEEVLVQPMSGNPVLEHFDDSSVPVQLRSEDERLTVLLQLLRFDVPAARALSSHELLPVLVLRWVVQTLHGRAQEGGKEREKERWTRNEARCFLASFAWASARSAEPGAPPIVDRNAQLVAQVAMALESIASLAEVLLLSERIPSTSLLRWSGTWFHALLTGASSPEARELPEPIWTAAMEGLDEVFSEERKKKDKKTRAAAEDARPVRGKLKNPWTLFDLLENGDA